MSEINRDVFFHFRVRIGICWNWILRHLDFFFFLVLEQWQTFCLPGSSHHWAKNCSNCSNSILSFLFSGLYRTDSELLMGSTWRKPFWYFWKYVKYFPLLNASLWKYQWIVMLTDRCKRENTIISFSWVEISSQKQEMIMVNERSQDKTILCNKPEWG